MKCNQLQQLRKQLVSTISNAILDGSSGNPLLFGLFWIVFFPGWSKVWCVMCRYCFCYRYKSAITVVYSSSTGTDTGTRMPSYDIRWMMYRVIIIFASPLDTVTIIFSCGGRLKWSKSLPLFLVAPHHNFKICTSYPRLNDWLIPGLRSVYRAGAWTLFFIDRRDILVQFRSNNPNGDDDYQYSYSWRCSCCT